LSDNSSLENCTIEFQGWPSLDIRIVGNGFYASLRTSQLRALIKLQETIYYQFALQKNKSKTTLSNSERDELELNLSVDKGSTQVIIDLTQILEQFVQADTSVAGMIFVIALSVIYGATSVAKSYLEHKNDATNRMLEVISEVVKENNKMSLMSTSAYEALDSLSRSAPKADMEINRAKVISLPAPDKKKNTSERHSEAPYIIGKFYECHCKVVGLTKPIGGKYEFKFMLEDDTLLDWKPRKGDISNKLHHEISMAYNSKKTIYIGFEPTKKINLNLYLIIVRSIFEPHKKPRSYK